MERVIFTPTEPLHWLRKWLFIKNTFIAALFYKKVYPVRLVLIACAAPPGY